MKSQGAQSWLVFVPLLVAVGCIDEQYVSPDTVALVVTLDGSKAASLDKCYGVPVLLGSRVVSSYTVDDSLRLSLDMTRDEIVVSFESDTEVIEPFKVPSERFADAAQVQDPTPPSGYSVELISPCLP